MKNVFSHRSFLLSVLPDYNISPIWHGFPALAPWCPGSPLTNLLWSWLWHMTMLRICAPLSLVLWGFRRYRGLIGGLIDWIYPSYPNPANTTHPSNVWPMLAHRLRRWPNIGQTLDWCVVFAGKWRRTNHRMIGIRNGMIILPFCWDAYSPRDVVRIQCENIVYNMSADYLLRVINNQGGNIITSLTLCPARHPQIGHCPRTLWFLKLCIWLFRCMVVAGSVHP